MTFFIIFLDLQKETQTFQEWDNRFERIQKATEGLNSEA